MSIYEKATSAHEEWKGKLSVEVKPPLSTRDDLSVAYTPGVAAPCLEIRDNPDRAYDLTWKGNTIAVVTDGSAVLGLGDIGALAGLPVMEGKAALFKRFGGVNAVPICLPTRDVEEIIRTVKLLAPAFGGINLEDISAPRCVEIERRLIDELDIPVFHDDQHGTAIVVTAALMNALKLVGKRKEDVTVVVSGAGAAGSSVIKMLLRYGVGKVLAFDINGIINKQKCADKSPLLQELAQITNPQQLDVSLSDAMKQADVFVGVSAPRLLSREMVASMKKDAIVFAMANPEPEITYAEAVAAGARVAGTGRSDFPNQINNVLAFPGIFKGALAARATKITEDMKLAASEGIAGLVTDAELNEEYVVPSVFDERVCEAVAAAVMNAAK